MLTKKVLTIPHEILHLSINTKLESSQRANWGWVITYEIIFFNKSVMLKCFNSLKHHIKLCKI